MTTQQKRELLIIGIKEEILNDEQINFLYKLSTMFLNGHCNLNDLFELANIEREKIDTATPIDYYRRIEEIYPGFKNGNMVYDYRTAKFGEMLNINDMIVKRILSIK